MYDYTHYFKLKTGFQDEVISQLVEEIEKLNVKEFQKFVGLLVDKMKVKEGLVHSGSFPVGVLIILFLSHMYMFTVNNADLTA